MANIHDTYDMRMHRAYETQAYWSWLQGVGALIAAACAILGLLLALFTDVIRGPRGQEGGRGPQGYMGPEGDKGSKGDAGSKGDGELPST